MNDEQIDRLLTATESIAQSLLALVRQSETTEDSWRNSVAYRQLVLQKQREFAEYSRRRKPVANEDAMKQLDIEERQLRSYRKGKANLTVGQVEDIKKAQAEALRNKSAALARKNVSKKRDAKRQR